MEDKNPLHEEERRLRRLRLLVDVTAQVLAEDESLTFCEALRLIEAARTASTRLFPDKEPTFDLVIRPRLERIVHERFQIPSLARSTDPTLYSGYVVMSCFEGCPSICKLTSSPARTSTPGTVTEIPPGTPGTRWEVSRVSGIRTLSLPSG